MIDALPLPNMQLKELGPGARWNATKGYHQDSSLVSRDLASYPIDRGFET